MNELTVKTADLPALATEEVKQCVDLIGDAIQALKSKRNAAGHIGASKAVIDEMDTQIREYSAMKLKAEIELGKRTAAMPKAVNQHNVPHHGVVEQTKTEALSEMGITQQRASDYERMAKHEAVVSDYIDRQLERGETPTKAGAMQEIRNALPKPKTAGQMARENIREIQSAPVVDIRSAETIRQEQRIIDRETADGVERKLHNAIVSIGWYVDVQPSDIHLVKRTMHEAEISSLLDELLDGIGYLSKIISVLEGSK